MMHAFAKTGLALLLAACSAGAVLASEAYLVDSITTGDVLQQRIDTEEVLLPPAPTGPATPIPFCSPSSPICP